MHPACTLDHNAAPTPLVVAEAVAEAAAKCAAAGERWTAPRRRTYELLVAAGAPVKAYDLIAALLPGRALAKPPTVYRALEFLTDLGLVHRVESLHAFVACRGSGSMHSGQFLICSCCGRVEERELGAGPPVLAAAEAIGFQVHRVVLEAMGVCADCR